MVACNTNTIVGKQGGQYAGTGFAPITGGQLGGSVTLTTPNCLRFTIDPNYGPDDESINTYTSAPATGSANFGPKICRRNSLGYNQDFDLGWVADPFPINLYNW
ncbi:hypothetical protein LTR85_002187 [Meristemomyces frigidus]|nr:hypothetical protein LTR85_002187 [Meristemomyces frigidus]